MAEFDEIIAACKRIEKKKRHDYSQKNNRWSNFEYASRVAAPFKDPIARVFATLIGVKLARLAELEGSDKRAKNESLDDTHIDHTNYAALFGAWSRQRRRSHKVLSKSLAHRKRHTPRHKTSSRILIRRAPQ